MNEPLILLIHPVAWLFYKAMEYRHAGLDSTTWILFAVIGIPVWAFITRLLAELPGIKTGSMYLWWAVFAIFHVWGFVIYLVFEKWSLGYVIHQRIIRRIMLSDRRPDDITASPFGIAGEEDHAQSLTPTLPTVHPEDKSILSSEKRMRDR